MNENVTQFPKVFEGSPPGGGGSMEARIASLETHVEHMRSDIGEIKSDLKDVSGKVDRLNTRLAYAAGALFGGTVLAGWLLSGKLESIISLIQATP